MPEFPKEHPKRPPIVEETVSEQYVPQDEQVPELPGGQSGEPDMGNRGSKDDEVVMEVEEEIVDEV